MLNPKQKAALVAENRLCRLTDAFTRLMCDPTDKAKFQAFGTLETALWPISKAEYVEVFRRTDNRMNAALSGMD